MWHHGGAWYVIGDDDAVASPHFAARLPGGPALAAALAAPASLAPAAAVVWHPHPAHADDPTHWLPLASSLSLAAEVERGFSVVVLANVGAAAWARAGWGGRALLQAAAASPNGSLPVVLAADELSGAAGARWLRFARVVAPAPAPGPVPARLRDAMRLDAGLPPAAPVPAPPPCGGPQGAVTPAGLLLLLAAPPGAGDALADEEGVVRELRGLAAAAGVGFARVEVGRGEEAAAVAAVAASATVLIARAGASASIAVLARPGAALVEVVPWGWPAARVPRSAPPADVAATALPAAAAAWPVCETRFHLWTAAECAADAACSAAALHAPAVVDLPTLRGAAAAALHLATACALEKEGRSTA